MTRLLFVALWGCAPPSQDPPYATPADSGTSALDPLAWAADELGPYGAGHRSWPITYTGAPRESRTIEVHVWFPTHDPTGDPVRYGGVYPAGESILGGATPSEPAHDRGWPVMVFSHGDRAYGGSAEYLMAHFASHGWVAIAPDHTDNLLWANADPTPQGHWYHRPLDILASLEAVKQDAELNRADTDRWLMTGHSRGTSTVWAIAGATFDEDNPESWCPDCTPEQVSLFSDGSLTGAGTVAALPLAGTIRTSLFGDDGHRSVALPVMHLSGSEDDVGQAAEFDRLDGLDYTWVDFEGACHQTFTIGACSSLDTEDGWWLIESYALAFARYHVLDDRTAPVVEWVEGTQTLDPRARYARRTE